MKSRVNELIESNGQCENLLQVGRSPPAHESPVWCEHSNSSTTLKSGCLRCHAGGGKSSICRLNSALTTGSHIAVAYWYSPLHNLNPIAAVSASIQALSCTYSWESHYLFNLNDYRKRRGADLSERWCNLKQGSPPFPCHTAANASGTVN